MLFKEKLRNLVSVKNASRFYVIKFLQKYQKENSHPDFTLGMLKEPKICK